MSEWSLTRSFASSQGTIRWDCLGEGPPLVLLHGTPASSFLWRKVLPHLAEQWRVYYFDWPGYGLSERHPDQNLSWDEQARQLPALFAHWGLERPAVVAHDVAPMLLLRAHLLERLLVGPMVLADAAVIPPFVTGFSAHARDHIGVFRNIPVHIAEAMIRRHLETTVYEPMPSDVLDVYMRPWSGQDGVAAYWRVVAAYDENLARRVAAALPSVAERVLVLWGEQDAWEPARKARELAARIPAAELTVIADAGHFLPEERSEAFSEAVLSFLAWQ